MKATTKTTGFIAHSKRMIFIAKGVIAALMILAATTEMARAQGQLGGGTVLGTGSGPYTYDLTFSDAAGATASIGYIWYAWIPGQFFLPSSPTAASAPAGWTATVSGNSVQFAASSSASYITAGSSLSGFSYIATFTPAQLAAAPNSGESVAYHAGLFSDGGNTFTVLAVPEPSSALLLLVPALVWVVARRRLFWLPAQR